VGKPHNAADPDSLPTVTEKVASDLGIDEDTVGRRFKTTLKLAERGGFVPESGETLETISAEEQEE
jgi:hypothetical protein